jgi:hypothetical protein
VSSNPHSWDSGPPESKAESWNWERRSELLNVASGLMQAQVMAAVKQPESWQGDASPLDSIDATRAVTLAQQLIEATEKVRPKL